MKMADLGCVELVLGVECSCGATVPINGPRRMAKCSTCETSIELDGVLRWRTLLGVGTPPVDVFKLSNTQKDGAVHEISAAPIKLTSTRAWPRCVCGRSFEPTKLMGAIANGQTTIKCPKCSVEVGVDRAPAYFRVEFPSVLTLVGADTIPDVTAGLHIKPNAKPPVISKWWALFDRSK